MGTIQCDIQSGIQSDIRQVLLSAPLWADEMRVVSVETSSSTLAGTRDTSPRKQSHSVRSLLGSLSGCRAPCPKDSDSAFTFHLSPALYVSFLKMVKCRGQVRRPLLCRLKAKFTHRHQDLSRALPAFLHPVQLCGEADADGRELCPGTGS